jgi:hypothetical protein
MGYKKGMSIDNRGLLLVWSLSPIWIDTRYMKACLFGPRQLHCCLHFIEKFSVAVGTKVQTFLRQCQAYHLPQSKLTVTQDSVQILVLWKVSRSRQRIAFFPTGLYHDRSPKVQAYNTFLLGYCHTGCGISLRSFGCTTECGEPIRPI